MLALIVTASRWVHWDLREDIFESDKVELSLKSLEHDEPKLQADLQDDNVSHRSEDSKSDPSEVARELVVRKQETQHEYIGNIASRRLLAGLVGDPPRLTPPH
jgi:hypothetical protein